MNLPKMIVFDYGHTLLYEKDFSIRRGYEALHKHIKRNTNGLTAGEISDFAQGLFTAGLVGEARRMGIDLHEWQFLRFCCDYLEIEYAVSIPEAERIFWDNITVGGIMPNAGRMLRYIKGRGIRSGVISNIAFSGAALTERINRFLPDNELEFIMASSEYMFRKPNPMLFEIALKKAALPAGEVWFCGDNIIADVEGASAVGIYPVWYDDETLENPFRMHEKGAKPRCPHLHISDWDELIEVLDRLEAAQADFCTR